MRMLRETAALDGANPGGAVKYTCAHGVMFEARRHSSYRSLRSYANHVPSYRMKGLVYTGFMDLISSFHPACPIGMSLWIEGSVKNVDMALFAQIREDEDRVDCAREGNRGLVDDVRVACEQMDRRKLESADSASGTDGDVLEDLAGLFMSHERGC